MRMSTADLEYLAAYLRTGRCDHRIMRYSSRVCQECMIIPTDALARNVVDAHTIDDVTGVVLIGCDGYHQINPNVLGLDRPDWSDWTGEIGTEADEIRDPRFNTDEENNQ